MTKLQDALVKLAIATSGDKSLTMDKIAQEFINRKLTKPLAGKMFPYNEIDYSIDGDVKNLEHFLHLC